MLLLRSKLSLARVSTYEKADLNGIKNEKRRLEVLLEPFTFKRECFSLLFYYCQRCVSYQQGHLSTSELFYILQSERKSLSKSALFAQRFKYLRQINKEISDEYSGAWPMEQSLMLQASITPKVIRALRYKQMCVKHAQDKYNTIAFDIDRCHKIQSCTSLQHHLPQGCPVCHVMYIGTADDNRYIESVDRDSGILTSKPLEYELSVLLMEQDAQRLVVAESQEQLDNMEQPLRQHTAWQLQQWICCRISRKRNQRKMQRYFLSLYYFRIRRLVRMKSYIDALFKHTKNARLLMRTISTPSMVPATAPDGTADGSTVSGGSTVADSTVAAISNYMDLYIEFKEYVEFIVARRRRKLDKLARLFIERCKERVDASRMRRYAAENAVRAEHEEKERQRLQRIKDKQYYLLTKRLEKIESRKWICRNGACNSRVFYSQDRYDTHMKQHERERERREVQALEISARRDVNFAKEYEFLYKLYEYRLHDTYLTQLGADEGS